MATDRKFLQFRSTPETGVDISILGSLGNEEVNEKIIQGQLSQGAQYHGPMVQTALERVRQARICVAVWAVAYEFFDHSLVTDAIFDETCIEVQRDLAVDTDKPKMDKWYRKNFVPDTGQWVHKHPDLKNLKQKAKQMIWLKENLL